MWLIIEYWDFLSILIVRNVLQKHFPAKLTELAGWTCGQKKSVEAFTITSSTVCLAVPSPDYARRTNIIQHHYTLYNTNTYYINTRHIMQHTAQWLVSVSETSLILHFSNYLKLLLVVDRIDNGHQVVDASGQEGR